MPVGLSQLIGVNVAQVVGLKVGQYLGRQIVLGACLSDAGDDLDPRTFRARTPAERLPRGVDLRRWLTPTRWARARLVLHSSPST